MANEGEQSTSADKGKGKVDDVRELNGKKPHTDEKATAEGKKKDEEPQEGRSRGSSRQVLLERSTRRLSLANGSRS